MRVRVTCNWLDRFSPMTMLLCAFISASLFFVPSIAGAEISKTLGDFTEYYMDEYFKSTGKWQKIPSQYHGNKGIDGLYINKKGKVLVVEAKFNKSPLNCNTRVGCQMGDWWIKDRISKIPAKSPAHAKQLEIANKSIANDNYRTRIFRLNVENNSVRVTIGKSVSTGPDVSVIRIKGNELSRWETRNLEFPMKSKDFDKYLKSRPISERKLLLRERARFKKSIIGFLNEKRRFSLKDSKILARVILATKENLSVLDSSHEIRMIRNLAGVFGDVHGARVVGVLSKIPGWKNMVISRLYSKSISVGARIAQQVVLKAQWMNAAIPLMVGSRLSMLIGLATPYLAGVGFVIGVGAGVWLLMQGQILEGMISICLGVISGVELLILAGIIPTPFSLIPMGIVALYMLYKLNKWLWQKYIEPIKEEKEFLYMASQLRAYYRNKL